MDNYVISCCSPADLTKEHIERRDIKYVCFHFYLNDKEYTDDMGQSISFDDFYKAMQIDADTRTSQVNADEFIEYFEGFLKEGKDICHITLSSGISGVYNSACIARDELAEKYPDRKIRIVDSLGACGGYGLLVDTAADLRDSGMGFDELCDTLDGMKKKIHHWFFTTDLKYFVRGGRVTKVAGFVGTLLKICPLLNVDAMGKLIPREKIRTKAAVIEKIVEKMVENADNGVNYDGKCYLNHSACPADAEAVRDKIEAKIPALKGKIVLNSIGTTIGCHTGPGTVALFFVGKERE